MFRAISCCTLVLISVELISISSAADPAKPQRLADAVKEFNQLAQQDKIGKEQPPLTEDEVVAAIQGWIRDQMPVSDSVYNSYQEVAQTRQLPSTAKLDFTTGWSGHKNLYFDVWWIDLTILEGSKHGYTYRLRDRKIKSRPMNASDDVLTVPVPKSVGK